MMCLKDLLLYTLLLPIPAASPIFITLYALAVVLTLKPCGYCIAMFAALFLTCSPSSPFVEKPHAHVPIDSRFPLTSPSPVRDWLSSNAGRWADPGLVGYRHIADMWSDVQGIKHDGQDREERDGLDGREGQQGENGLEGEKNTNTASRAQVPDPQPEAQAGMEDTDDEQSAQAYQAGYATHMPIFGRVRSAFGTLRNRISPSDITSSPPLAEPFTIHDTAPDPTTAEMDLGIETISTPSDAPAAINTATSGRSSFLPPGYLDLRFRGIGLVLDLGLSRTEQGMEWEMADARRAADSAKASPREREQGRRSSSKSSMPESRERGPEHGDAGVNDMHEDRGGVRGLWSRLPLVGASW